MNFYNLIGFKLILQTFLMELISAPYPKCMSPSVY